MSEQLNHENALSIGEGKWIKYIDTLTDADSAFDLDSMLRETEAFWQSLEIHCVADCCGMDAFSFWPKDLQAGADHCQVPDLLKKLTKLKDQIEQHSPKCYESDLLN